MNLLLVLFIILLYCTHAVKRFEMVLEPVFKDSNSLLRNIESKAQISQGSHETHKSGTRRYLKSVAQEIDNIRNLEYHGTLYMGPEKQKMTFQYDTGSSWIVFPTTLCKECTNHNLYDINGSLDLPKDHKQREKAFANIPVYDITYGDGSNIDVTKVQEDVYLSKDGPQVVKNLVMFGIVSARNYERSIADGILGLGPSHQKSGRINFVTTLKEQGIIDDEIVSFDYKPVGMDSRIIFGDIDTEVVKNKSDIAWIPMKGGTNYWILSINSVYYGDKKLHYQPKYAIIDTGSSDLVLAQWAFLDFMAYHLNRSLDCSFSPNKEFVECGCEGGLESFPKFTFNINGYDLVLGPEEYILKVGKSCSIQIFNIGSEVNMQDTIILGVNFLRKYFTIFDIKNSKIGIYGKGVTRNKNSTPKYKLYLVLTSLLALVAIITAILFMCEPRIERSFSQGGKMH
ncbi:unnamed protein product [Moneuplotes crassus]|uniref:Peptidase A1 domain-containing protein n=1 Tax=Euplotes crassus TaxID=5936 RepID=A0AAD1UF37_EUPCR|nr:unnamed protein product [Moneuplotes crassus]